ncbi:hypothetical protein [Thermococcus sp.]|uniref:hypothetical protein n=1 Tax=Thermococcus sp. TaxID=35749 RepID=UPI002637A518|nr:hypothetical protein [Thermococcus sp.]
MSTNVHNLMFTKTFGNLSIQRKTLGGQCEDRSSSQLLALSLFGMALNGSIVLATAVTTTNSLSCNCQNNSGSCILTKALMDVGSWKASSVNIRDYRDVNSILSSLHKEGYSPIEQYTKIYTTTPGIKVIAVPLASKQHPHVTKINDTLIMNTVVILNDVYSQALYQNTRNQKGLGAWICVTPSDIVQPDGDGEQKSKPRYNGTDTVNLQRWTTDTYQQSDR